MAPGAILDQQDVLPSHTKDGHKISQDALINEALDAARSRFEASHPTSKNLHEEAALSLPGGNTRTLLHYAPFPIFVKSGSGYQVTDEDNHTSVNQFSPSTSVA